MTAVNVTTDGKTVVVEDTTTNTVSITTTGPQGPAVDGFFFDGTAKVDNSIVYYDSSAGEFKADDTWTIQTLVTGGNF
mgnify:CR=1 FL=1|jgi:hypothetical protein|tara:strand:+ start:297 stop:530 length:234 start_codon:yes stop_codon:yes gene_type:complete